MWKNHDVGLSHTTRVNGIATDKPEAEDNDGHTTLIHSNPEINDQHDEIEKVMMSIKIIISVKMMGLTKVKKLIM